MINSRLYYGDSHICYREVNFLNNRFCEMFLATFVWRGTFSVLCVNSSLVLSLVVIINKVYRDSEPHCVTCIHAQRAHSWPIPLCGFNRALS